MIDLQEARITVSVQNLVEEMEANPLAVLPASMASSDELLAEDAELIGNYAIRIRFSDGHQTGIFSWSYLRSIDPKEPPPPAEPDS